MHFLRPLYVHMNYLWHFPVCIFPRGKFSIIIQFDPTDKFQKVNFGVNKDQKRLEYNRVVTMSCKIQSTQCPGISPNTYINRFTKRIYNAKSMLFLLFLFPCAMHIYTHIYKTNSRRSNAFRLVAKGQRYEARYTWRAANTQEEMATGTGVLWKEEARNK